MQFHDYNGSTITANGDHGLIVRSTGDDTDGTGAPGAMTIVTNGNITGIDGIVAQNAGSGSVSITVEGQGQITGAAGVGYPEEFDLVLWSSQVDCT